MNVIYQNDDSIDSDSALIKTHSKQVGIHLVSQVCFHLQ